MARSIIGAISTTNESLYSPTHLPLLQPTFHAPGIAVQSSPAPVDEHPPQDSSSLLVSRHSQSSVKPVRPGIGQASMPLGQRETLRALLLRFQP